MQTWPNASCLLGLAGAAAMGEVAPQNLFVWNPHWQCFVWNQNECAEHVMEALNMFLVAFDVDFATVIELADPSYESPSGWEYIVSKCGHDLVFLFYNVLRWTPLGPPYLGCMESEPEDRPFAIQPFLGASGDKVIAVGAHFPHPEFSPHIDVYEATADTQVLRDVLAEVRRNVSTEKVVLMADTNAWSWVSNEQIWQTQLDLPGSLVGTRLMQTCCLDADFPPAFTFDRIMANFGDVMQSTMLYTGDLPNWTHQVKGTKIGAFHRPVFARVELRSERGPTAVWVAMILLLISTIVLALTLLTVLLRKICKRRHLVDSSSSASSSESEQLS